MFRECTSLQNRIPIIDKTYYTMIAYTNLIW